MSAKEVERYNALKEIEAGILLAIDVARRFQMEGPLEKLEAALAQTRKELADLKH